MAIAFDSSSSGTNFNSASTSKTVAHTCSGSDRILFVSITTFDSTGGNVVSGITYAGVAMTKITEVAAQSNTYSSLWYLINPASGNNNIVASYSSQNYVWMAAASYTGAKQSGVPDASTGAADGSPPIAGSVTTVADNCWVVMGVYAEGQGLSNGAGTTLRATSPSDVREGIADNGSAQTPAGSVTLTVNNNAGAGAYVIASFAPSVTVAAPHKLLTLGAG